MSMQYPLPPENPDDAIKLAKANAINETASAARAGKYAVWVWIALALLPIAMVALCFLGCFGSLILGSVTPSTSPTP